MLGQPDRVLGSNMCWNNIPSRVISSTANQRVREKNSYPLVPWTSTILNLVVRNLRVLVQKVLLETQKLKRKLSQTEPVKTNKMSMEWRS